MLIKEDKQYFENLKQKELEKLYENQPKTD